MPKTLPKAHPKARQLQSWMCFFNLHGKVQFSKILKKCKELFLGVIFAAIANQHPVAAVEWHALVETHDVVVGCPLHDALVVNLGLLCVVMNMGCMPHTTKGESH